MNAVGKLLAVCLVAGSAVSVSAIEFQKIADTATPMPSGPGLFKEFTGVPVLDSGRVMFNGEGTNGFKGLYLYDSGLTRIADITTAAPGQQTNFFAFPGHDLKGSRAVFAGKAAWSGIFDGIPTLTTAVDGNSPIPSGSGTFTNIGLPRIAGNYLAFNGTGAGGQQGIYSTIPGRERIADRTTPAPWGGNLVDLFMGDADGDAIAFRGIGGGEQGIFLSTPGNGLQLLANTQTPPPGFADFVDFDSQFPVSNGMVAFHEDASDGWGIYLFDGSSLQRKVSSSTPIPNTNETFGAVYALFSLDAGPRQRHSPATLCHTSLIRYV